MQLLKKNSLALAFLGLTLLLTGIIWLVLPHDREVKSLGILLFKLLPFVSGTLTICYLDIETFKRFRLHYIIIPSCFLTFFCIFVPQIFSNSDDFPSLYYIILTLTPFIILSLITAFRLGGGSRESTLRLSFAMLLFMLSGLEDLSFLLMNPQWAQTPVWKWASHMTVFLGHPPTRYEAYAFITVHVILALLVLFLPSKVITRSLPAHKLQELFRRQKNVSSGSVVRHP